MRRRNGLLLGATAVCVAGAGYFVSRSPVVDSSSTASLRLERSDSASPASPPSSPASLGLRPAPSGERTGENAAATAAERGASAALFERAMEAKTAAEWRALGELFAAAAATDLEGALAALSRLSAQRSAREVEWAARAVLDAILDDADSIQAWLDAIPQPGSATAATASVDSRIASTAVARLYGSGLTALARLDPNAAFALWLELEEGSSNAASDETIRAWVEHDALGTLQRIAAASADTRVRDRLLREWSATEPVAALDYAASLADFGGDTAEAKELAFATLAMRGLRDAAMSVDALLAAAARLPEEAADPVRAVAIRALATDDPDAAAARLGELGEASRAIVVYEIAQRYAEREPVSALAWARAQGIAEGELAVIRGTAAADPYRGLELALLTSEAVRDEAIDEAISVAVNRNPALAPDLARRLNVLPRDSERYATAMANLTAVYFARRPDDALEWTIANAATLPNAVHAAAADAVDSAAAERILDRLPQRERAIWIERRAARQAAYDECLAAAAAGTLSASC